MRWRVNIKPYMGPMLSDLRYRRRFALVPVMIDDYWYWLEWYYAVQEYSEVRAGKYRYHSWEFRGRISPREYARRRQCGLVAG